MATSQSYLEFILDQLSNLEDITYRMMMGEYIIYYRGRIAAYICDDRFLIKPVNKALEILPNAPLEPPYKGAKNMILLEDVDNKEFMAHLFNEIFDELAKPKPKKVKK